MLSLLFHRRMRLKSAGPGTPQTLRHDVAAAVRAQPLRTQATESLVYWTGAFMLVCLAGVIGRLSAEDMRQGAVHGLLVGLALVALLLVVRHRRYGTMRPPLGRRTLYRFEARALRRSLLTPVRAGLLIAATFSASLAGGGGEAGMLWSALFVVFWTVPLALLYWALESFIGPARVNGAHLVLPVPILVTGFLILPSPSPPAFVFALLIAAIAHVVMAVIEDL